MRPVIPDVPWQEREFSPSEARRRGLLTQTQISEGLGYGSKTVRDWSSKHADFPKARAVLVPAPGHRTRIHLYSAKEVADWVKKALSDKRINHPWGSRR